MRGLALLLLAAPALGAASLPEKALLPVPIVRQAATYSCGAAALLAVLYYWQVYDGTETGLYERLETTEKDGTEPAKLAEAAKGFGLSAELREGMAFKDLRSALDAGKTVILDFQAWRDAKSTVSWTQDWEDGHYAVLVGMDEDKLHFMDPSTPASYTWILKTEFLDRWHDYEDRHGVRKVYRHAGVVIGGKQHLKAYPAEPTRLD